MSVYNLPDYKERYFEHKTLTKVHGPPTADSILQVYKETKRNAQSVPTTLGGGQLGYLALVVTTAAWAAIPTAGAWICPTDPGPFTLVPNPTPPATRANPHPAPPPLRRLRPPPPTAIPNVGIRLPRMSGATPRHHHRTS